MAQSLANPLVTESAGTLGLSVEAARGEARRQLHAAEVRSRFFEETVVPYLGTAGPVGRIAEQQLGLLAWEHVGHRDYRDEWYPRP